MKTPRREALQLLGAVGIGAASGCLERLGDTTGEATTTDNETTEADTPDETTTTDNETTETDAASDLQAADFRWEATVLERASETTPANVELELTNASDGTAVAGFGPTPPFSMPLPDSDESRVPVLFDPEMGPNGDVPEEPEGDCWTVQVDELGINDVRNRKRLEPDETVTNTYTLLAQSDVGTEQDGCFADETYTYTDAVALGSNEERELKLSFDVVVEDSTVEDLTALQPEIQ